MRTNGLAAAGAVLLGSGCVAHAPVRTAPDERAPSAITTSVAELADPARRDEVARHPVEIHPGYTLAFVEFDDQGQLWSRPQIELLGFLDAFVRKKNAGGRLTTDLTVIGHSFGGAAVYTALANVLKARLVEALTHRDTGVPASGVIEGFGDLVLLVNPAFEASLYAPIRALLAEFPSFSPFQPIVAITVASETDGALKTWFKLGRTLDTFSQKTGSRLERDSLVTAIGSYDPFVTHRLRLAEGAHVPRPDSDAFGRVAGCSCELPVAPSDERDLRDLMALLAAPKEGAAVGAEPPPLDDSRAADTNVPYGRADLSRLPSTDPLNPFWVVRASDDLMHGHSAFFTTGLIDFVRRVVAESLERKYRLAAVRKAPGTQGGTGDTR